MSQRNEVHLCDFPNGHILSTDCWCEPVNIQWVTNIHGIKMLVVEHVDDTPLHRTIVLGARRNASDWITRALNKAAHPQ